MNAFRVSRKEAGRLAFRVEGDKWTCYYAPPHTMEGAIYMGQVMMGIVHDRKRKEKFMALMRDALSDFLEEKFGEQPIWPEPHGHPAPESERSGSA